MQIEERVTAYVAEVLVDRADLFLVKVTMQGNGLLSILIDGDNGVDVQDCALVSRYVGNQLEENDIIETAYQLEVSSPGLENPFLHVRQYHKNKGRSVSVQLVDGLKVEGVLLEITEEGIQLEESIKEKGKKATTRMVDIPFGQIKTTKVLISFK
jgi:ribosome maturation factor RimP